MVLLIALLIVLLNIFKASNFFPIFQGKKRQASSRKKHMLKFNCFPNLATLQIKAN